MIRPWFRQAAVPWKTTAHPDQSIWGESSLHQTRGAPEPDAVAGAYLVVSGQVDGDGLADAAAGGASVAGGGSPDGVVRADGAECGERAGETVGSRAGEAGECVQGAGGCGDEHVVLGAVVAVADLGGEPGGQDGQYLGE